MRPSRRGVKRVAKRPSFAVLVRATVRQPLPFERCTRIGWPAGPASVPFTLTFEPTSVCWRIEAFRSGAGAAGAGAWASAGVATVAAMVRAASAGLRTTACGVVVMGLNPFWPWPAGLADGLARATSSYARYGRITGRFAPAAHRSAAVGPPPGAKHARRLGVGRSNNCSYGTPHPGGYREVRHTGA